MIIMYFYSVEINLKFKMTPIKYNRIYSEKLILLGQYNCMTPYLLIPQCALRIWWVFYLQHCSLSSNCTSLPVLFFTNEDQQGTYLQIPSWRLKKNFPSNTKQHQQRTHFYDINDTNNFHLLPDTFPSEKRDLAIFSLP